MISQKKVRASSHILIRSGGLGTGLLEQNFNTKFFFQMIHAGNMFMKAKNTILLNAWQKTQELEDAGFNRNCPNH